jgi:glycosyltransferase involved in cell wall biosynthesis
MTIPSTRKRIAVITHGGIIGGDFNQGVPALVELFGRLGERYDITVYQAARPESPAPARPFAVRTFGRRLANPRLFLALLRDHTRHPYELVHGLWGGSGYIAVWAARLLRVPSVVTLLGGEVANLPEIAYGGLTDKRKARRLEHVCDRATTVVTLSRFQDAKLKEVHAVDSSVVPLGVDTQRFAFQDRPIEVPCQFIHVANLTEVKDQTTLIKTFALLRARIDCRLTIVGPDHLGGELHRLVDSMGLNRDVTFTGAVRHAELPRYFERADVLLHTSLYESLAVVALEAMASGVVVCGTAVGILSDLNGVGCLAVAPGDSVELAQGVLRLLADPKELARMRHRAREWIAEHSIDATASAYSRIYEDSIDAHIGR